ncbi:PVC-type heme-binding CxxCH protein [Phragmitibacter flavus]|nr:PVC-type heme-binding CxxCH protein [Phragmitibacter flavus]
MKWLRWVFVMVPVLAMALEVPVKVSREGAWSVEESRLAFEIDGSYEVELVAAEPLVTDPVEVCWDEKGRCFVAEMRGYPLGPGEGKEPLSRGQQLMGDDGDGRDDRAVTFADKLDHVQGILPHDGGLIATTRTQILFLKDEDGDGVAEVRRPLIEGFNPSQSQLQVSSPRWGLDNRVYFNNGLDTKEVYPSEEEGKKVNLARTNFCWDPVTGEIKPVTGFGQFGAGFDDWGRYYTSSNRSPVMMAVMHFNAVKRNPHAGITQGWEDIAPSGAESRIYPLQVTHTTADAHAGTHTSACGLGVYRGDLMPELRGEIFVCDPTGQLVVRYHPEPNGASVKATRVGDRKEFLRSRDEWCRPVNVTTGPDGALYVCDMYRRYIDHARFFPESFLKENDIRQGENEGRIWRIKPKGAKVRKIEALPTDREALVKMLGHQNAWQRETARRILVSPLLKRPPEHKARVQMLEIAEISDDVVKITEAQIAVRARALAENVGDEWMLKAVLSASVKSSGWVLRQFFDDDGMSKGNGYSPDLAEIVRALVVSSVGNAHADDVKNLLSLLDRDKGQLLWWKPALLQGMAQGLPRSGGKLGVGSLKGFMEKPPAGHEKVAAEMVVLMKLADEVLVSKDASLEMRLACLPLLGQRAWEEAEEVLRVLLASGERVPVREGALGLLKGFPVEKTAPLLYELLPSLGPEARREVVTQLTGGKMVMDFFGRIERGEISAAVVEAETRWRYLHSANAEHKALAEKIFGKVDGDRTAVMERYAKALAKPGDAEKGKQVFMGVCMACHRFGGVGLEVGPDISDVRAKTPEALLSDVLDPNRMVEARWSAYQVEASDGRTLAGILVSETDDGVTLRMPGGVLDTVQRRDIKSMKSLDQSLMPAGLEGVITPEQMADLFAYLFGRTVGE